MTAIDAPLTVDLDAMTGMSPAELDAYLHELRAAPYQDPEAFTAAVEAGARIYLNAQRPQNTQDAYAEDVKVWTRFCADKGLDPELGELLLPALPSLLVAFVVWMQHEGVVAKVRGQGLVRKPPAPATMRRRLDGVADMLRAVHGVLAVPTGVNRNAAEAVRRYANQMTRARVAVNRGKAIAITEDDVRHVCLATPDTLIGLRNRTMLVLWWYSGWRVSEIAARHVEDITDTRRRLRIRADWSKTTDKTARADNKPGSPLNPVALWRQWLAESGITGGPAFRSIDRHGNLGLGALTRESVRRIFIGMCAAAGLDMPFTAHSVRHGTITALIDAGAPRTVIRRQVGSASDRHLDGYYEDREADEHNASHYLDL